MRTPWLLILTPGVLTPASHCPAQVAIDRQGTNSST